MKILGVDFGKKRVGIAISDERRTLAFPKEILLNDDSLFEKIKQVLEKENISEIVIGDSRNLKNEPNPISEDINKFISRLKETTNLSIHSQKEFFTSVEARGRTGKEKNNAKKVKKEEIKKVDASAAALILQRYLDKINK